MFPQSRVCPVCKEQRVYDVRATACQKCEQEAREEYGRDWRRLRLWLAFDQWLFEHRRL